MIHLALCPENGSHLHFRCFQWFSLSRNILSEYNIFQPSCPFHILTRIIHNHFGIQCIYIRYFVLKFAIKISTL